MNRPRLLARLIRNGLEYRFCRLTGQAPKITALSLELTQYCMGRCVMCNIWRVSGRAPDLPARDWITLLSSPALAGLREIDITGGEPFLRKDLPALIEAITGLKKKHLTRLRGVAITTNGFLTTRVLKNTPQMARRLAEEGLDLVFAVALDAIGPLHDRIRRVKDAWKKVQATLEGLHLLRPSFPNLIVGLKTTVLPQNLGELEAIADYADENGLFTIISPCLFTPNRYKNAELQDELAFSPQDRQRLAEFYRKDRFKWSYHREVMLEYLAQGRISRKCTAGFNYYFVCATGEVFPCPLIDFSLGCFTKTPFERLIRSSKAGRFRRTIGTDPQCQTCTEPGLERYALPFEGFTYGHL
ncbi:MAG: radical SAM protein, partial [Thermodesulfobacteriota bacterium]